MRAIESQRGRLWVDSMIIYRGGLSSGGYFLVFGVEEEGIRGESR